MVILHGKQGLLRDKHKSYFLYQNDMNQQHSPITQTFFVHLTLQMLRGIYRQTSKSNNQYNIIAALLGYSLYKPEPLKGWNFVTYYDIYLGEKETPGNLQR